MTSRTVSQAKGSADGAIMLHIYANHNSERSMYYIAVNALHSKADSAHQATRSMLSLVVLSKTSTAAQLSVTHHMQAPLTNLALTNFCSAIYQEYYSSMHLLLVSAVSSGPDQSRHLTNNTQEQYYAWNVNPACDCVAQIMQQLLLLLAKLSAAV
jgi:hypothetical protein